MPPNVRMKRPSLTTLWHSTHSIDLRPSCSVRMNTFPLVGSLCGARLPLQRAVDGEARDGEHLGEVADRVLACVVVSRGWWKFEGGVISG